MEQPSKMLHYLRQCRIYILQGYVICWDNLLDLEFKHRRRVLLKCTKNSGGGIKFLIRKFKFNKTFNNTAFKPKIFKGNKVKPYLRVVPKITIVNCITILLYCIKMQYLCKMKIIQVKISMRYAKYINLKVCLLYYNVI